MKTYTQEELDKEIKIAEQITQFHQKQAEFFQKRLEILEKIYRKQQILLDNTLN